MSHCIIFYSEENFLQHFGWGGPEGIEPVKRPANLPINTALSLTVLPPAFSPHWPQSGLPQGSGSWASLKIPQRVRAEPGRQTHFGALQFKISAFGVASHSLFGSRSLNHHSIFGGYEVIGIPISLNIGETCLRVPNGLVSSTILLAVAVPN